MIRARLKPPSRGYLVVLSVVLVTAAAGTASARGPAGTSAALQAGPPALGPAVGETFVRYKARGWKFMQVSPGDRPGFEQPNAGFELLGDFQTGRAAFGSGGDCPVQRTVNTHWDINTDLLLRRNITLPTGIHNVLVHVTIDNDFELFWNGQPVGAENHDGCPVRSEFVLEVPAEHLNEGDNLLAVRASDHGDESFVDIRVTGTF